MRVLVGCEFSGLVRDAFRARGHDAWSCDLLRSERGGPHIIGNVLDYLNASWDMLIQFAPCTYSTNSGVRWLYNADGVKVLSRWRNMRSGAKLFNRLMSTDIPRICGENPVPHRYAREIMGCYTQIIQPWQFGHNETKKTCLWLKGLPELKPTKVVSGREPRVHYAAPGVNRWKERSRTLQGVANAMAEQWG
jgi:hypothetical protein